MSAKIFCDRCGQEDTAKFRNATIEVSQGSFANIRASACSSPAWGKRWHLCGYCAYDLLLWTEQRNKAGKRAG